MKPNILTSGGTYFHFLEPERSAIDIETIAHALAHICRFTGHTSTFYSVAQHSVLVSHLVPPAFALEGLLHDASEAYLGDVAAPLKMLLPDYKAIEARVEAVVFCRFGLPPKLSPEVKSADRLALAIEQRALMPLHDDVWECESHPEFLPVGNQHLTMMPAAPEVARKLFMARFFELWKQANPCVVKWPKRERRPINCGTGHCSCIECHFEPANLTEWAGYDSEDDLK